MVERFITKKDEAQDERDNHECTIDSHFDSNLSCNALDRGWLAMYLLGSRRRDHRISDNHHASFSFRLYC
jgi:hypothetical protein